MKDHGTVFGRALTAVLILTLSTSLYSADKMPAEKAGSIGQPNGRLAFLREGSVWVMDVETRKQEVICNVPNGDGRLNWSPDNKKILFTRSGRIELQSPDMMGGRHKVYDIFMAFLDSAYANKPHFWLQITTELGSRDPEWSADGKKVVFWRDMNANYANALKPNYQVCTMEPDGSNIELIRKDWQMMESNYMISPSMNAQGDLAFTSFFDDKPQGIVVLKPDEYMLPADSIRSRGGKNLKKVAPCWSPDGKWITYVKNDINNPGIFVATADFVEDYLVFVPPVGTNLYTMAPSFSPDSKWLTFATNDGSIWICDITGNGARRMSGPGLDSAPAWSKAEANSQQE